MSTSALDVNLRRETQCLGYATEASHNCVPTIVWLVTSSMFQMRKLRHGIYQLFSQSHISGELGWEGRIWTQALLVPKLLYFTVSLSLVPAKSPFQGRSLVCRWEPPWITCTACGLRKSQRYRAQGLQSSSLALKNEATLSCQPTTLGKVDLLGHLLGHKAGPEPRSALKLGRQDAIELGSISH